MSNLRWTGPFANPFQAISKAMESDRRFSDRGALPARVWEYVTAWDLSDVTADDMLQELAADTGYVAIQHTDTTWWAKYDKETT